MSWTIADTEVSFIGDSTPPTLTRGSEATLPLVFEPQPGETTTVVPNDSGYSLNYGFNYEGPDERVPYLERYEAIRAYLDYSGDAVVRRGRTDRGEPWFRERLPGNAPVDSLVVAVEAPNSVPEDRSMWAIVVGGSDESTIPGEWRRIDLTLFVLAERDAYADREAVEAAFGDEITVS